MTAKLIFSDTDGTLIISGGDVSPDTIDAIRKQTVAGNLSIPVSAHTPKGIMNVVDKITNFCPTIAYNGALVSDEMGRPSSSQFFDAAEAVQLITKIDALKTQDLTWNVHSGYNWFSSFNKNPSVKEEEEIVGVRSPPVSLERIKDLKGIYKVLVIGKPDTPDKIIPTLQFDLPKLASVKSAPHLLEVMLKGANKGKAVKIVLDSFAIGKANTWAFGDNYNDEPMLKAVGHPILMDDASEELKSKLNIPLTLDNNHNGIVATLNEVSN